MKIDNEVKLDFQDVLIRPKRSQAASRSAVEITRRYTMRNSGRIWEGVPIIAANMDTVATFGMSRALAKHKMSTALHKFYSLDDIVAHFEVQKLNNEDDFTFYTMGVTDNDMAQLVEFKKRTQIVPNVCVDVANGYSEYFQDRVKRVRELLPKAIIMAGNVATPEMVQELILSGAADIVKVGIGPGSVCTTRKVAGVGYPQLSAVIECSDAAHGLGGHIVSDGGCNMPGDVAKAFGAGADFVMLGGMLAGHDECGGEKKFDQNTKQNYLEFYGMSSREAMEKHHGGVADYRAPEGKKVRVPYRGPVDGTVQEILGGLRSACSYVGAMRLKDLSKCTTFVRVNRTHNTVYGDGR